MDHKHFKISTFTITSVRAETSHFSAHPTPKHSNQCCELWGSMGEPTNHPGVVSHIPRILRPHPHGEICLPPPPLDKQNFTALHVYILIILLHYQFGFTFELYYKYMYIDVAWNGILHIYTWLL